MNLGLTNLGVILLTYSGLTCHYKQCVTLLQYNTYWILQFERNLNLTLSFHWTEVTLNVLCIQYFEKYQNRCKLENEITRQCYQTEN